MIFLNTHNLDETQRVCDKMPIFNTKLMEIGTPQELERSVSGKKTVIQLEQANEVILTALRKLPVENISVDANKLTIDVTNPEKENIAIFRAGGHVQSISVVGSTLEDAYLKLVRENSK
jgi:ABC-2 type transport system ATP-binding protein